MPTLYTDYSIETYTLPYVKWMTSVSLMHEAGHPKLVLWDNLEGWGWEVESKFGVNANFLSLLKYIRSFIFIDTWQ